MYRALRPPTRTLRPPTRTLQPGMGPYGHLPGPYNHPGGLYGWVWDPTAGYGAPQLCMGPYGHLLGPYDWVRVSMAAYWDPMAKYGSLWPPTGTLQLATGPHSCVWDPTAGYRGPVIGGIPLSCSPPSPRAHSLAVSKSPEWGLQGGMAGGVPLSLILFFSPPTESPHAQGAGPAAGHRPGEPRAAGLPRVPLDPAGHGAGRAGGCAERGVREPALTAHQPEACAAGAEWRKAW